MKSLSNSLFIPIQLDFQLISLRNASPAGVISQNKFGKLMVDFFGMFQM